MGTNYYWHRDVCEHCNRSNMKIHIGKSSGGWCFGLHVDPLGHQWYPSADGANPALRICDLTDWKKLWKEPKSKILDEYGTELSPKEMLGVITKRKWKREKMRTDDWLNSNYAVEGPNGLFRHRLDHKFCIAHGKGTWDLLIGEFS